MFFSIIFALTLGILVGIFTGLAPGIHINLVALLLFVNSAWFLKFTTPLVLAVFIVAMSITHTFFDFLPSIFLGAPEESTALSVLPGHKMLLKGKGYEAIRITTFGSLIGVFLILLITPIFIFFLPWFYDLTRKIMAFILIAASGFLILREKRDKKFSAFLVFMLSGITGLLSLSFYVVKQPLFPLLTGLFGTSMLFISIKKKVRIPKQNFSFEKLKKKEVGKATFSSMIAAPLCSFLPGLGAAQAAFLGSQFYKVSQKNFLLMLGIIGTLVTGLNFIALYAIGKPRSGVSVIVGKLLEINFSQLILLLIVILIAGSAATILVLKISKKFIFFIERINYSKLCFWVLLVLCGLTVLFSGWFGLLILAVTTALGIFTNALGIKKMHLMGCLLLPIILYYI